MRVPRLYVVINDILLLRVPLAYVDEGIIESVVVSSPALPIQAEYHTSAVPWDIRNLMTVIRVIGVGYINRLLIGIFESGTQRKP